VREAKENTLANVFIVFKVTNGRKDTEYTQSIQRQIREFNGAGNLVTANIQNIFRICEVCCFHTFDRCEIVRTARQLLKTRKLRRELDNQRILYLYCMIG
jgi:hypothetical protein